MSPRWATPAYERYPLYIGPRQTNPVLNKFVCFSFCCCGGIKINNGIASDPQPPTLFWQSFWHIIWKYTVFWAYILTFFLASPRACVRVRAQLHPELATAFMLTITTSWQRKRKRKRRRRWRRRSCTFLKSRDPHLASGEQHLETLEGQTINQNIKQHLKSINQSTNQPIKQSHK